MINHYLWVGTDSGLEIIKKAPQGWRLEKQELPGKAVIALAYHPQQKDLVYATVPGHGLFKRDYQNQSWQQVLALNASAFLLRPLVPSAENSLSDESNQAQALDPLEIWVGSEPVNLYRSQDSGQSWQDYEDLLQALPNALNWDRPTPPYQARVSFLYQNPHQPQNLFGGIEVGGLLVSQDGGQSWYQPENDLDEAVQALAIHPNAAQVYLAATGDGVYRSLDGGITWEDHSQGLSQEYISQVCILNYRGLFGPEQRQPRRQLGRESKHSPPLCPTPPIVPGLPSLI